MAAVMTNNMNDIKKITFFMEECRRMGTPVLGPDVNESTFKFTVNKNHEIRFGLGAVKGVGEGAVEAIVNERKENGPFTSIFDVTKRVDLRAANKRTFENMALAGAFDSFEGIHRAVYFSDTGDGMTFLEKALKFGASHQEGMNSSQVSLFGEASEVDMPEPEIPKATEWGTMEKLSKEKDVVGIYLSGHPLDDFKFEISQFCNATVKELHNFEALKGRKEIKIAGIVTEVAHRMTKTGKPFGILTIEDYQDAFKFFMFGDEYVKFKGYLNMGWFLYLVGSIEPGKWDKTKLEFKFTRVELLAEIKDKMTKSITLDVNIDEVSDDFINQIESIVNSSNGNCKFSLNLIDRKEKNAVVLTSRSKKIALTDEVLNTFDKMQGVEYSVG